MAEEVMLEGTVKFFNTEKKFGFIIPKDGSNPKGIFFHITKVRDAIEPREGEMVWYTWEQGEKGPQAKEVVVPEEDSQTA